MRPYKVYFDTAVWEGLYLGSELRLPLDVVFQIHVLPVKHSISERRNPVAQDEHARRAAEHQVQLDVTVAVDEIVDVRMQLEIILRIALHVHFYSNKLYLVQ